MLDLGDVTLSCRLAGEGPLVLCAHGFPDVSNTFRHQVGPLVERGFRVACPTMRGYAPSGVARSGRYDVEALGEDLCALADRLSPDAPVRLVGHDWGALAAYAATALSPRRFSSLVTMAVPHPRSFLRGATTPAQLRRSWYSGLFQLRRVAEARLAARDFALVERLWRDWSPGYAASAQELGEIKAAIAPRVPEVLAYYRALVTRSALFGASRRLLLTKTAVPSLHVHGARDGCIGAELLDGVEAHYCAGVAVHRVPDAGHFVHLERPAVVTELLLDFFGKP